MLGLSFLMGVSYAAAAGRDFSSGECIQEWLDGDARRKIALQQWSLTQTFPEPNSKMLPSTDRSVLMIPHSLTQGFFWNNKVTLTSVQCGPRFNPEPLNMDDRNTPYRHFPG